MKRKQFQSFIFIVIAFFFVSTALFFFQDAEVTTGPSSKPINMIIPFLATEPGLALESKIVLYPETPAPGDFLIVEAGPFPENEALKIETRGACVVTYLAGYEPVPSGVILALRKMIASAYDDREDAVMGGVSEMPNYSRKILMRYRRF